MVDSSRLGGALRNLSVFAGGILSTTELRILAKKISDADQNFSISTIGLMLYLLLASLSIIAYLTFAKCLFSQWLFFLVIDREMSREQRF